MNDTQRELFIAILEHALCCEVNEARCGTYDDGFNFSEELSDAEFNEVYNELANLIEGLR